MPAPKNIIPSASLHLHIPEDLKARLDLELFSEVEGRVPKGAYQRLVVSLLRRHFEARPLDLASLRQSIPPGTYIIQAPSHILTKLIELIQGESE